MPVGPRCISGLYRELKRGQKTAKEADREKMIRHLLEEEARRKREAAAKAQMKALRVCPVGFQWIKQYRSKRYRSSTYIYIYFLGRDTV